MELLRLAGSPGVGKSAVGWTLVKRLADRGEPVAYVDIDQLGMCYPPPEGDPYRGALKERALARIARCYRQAGVARLVVSGVASPDLPPPEAPEASVTSLWLDAAAEVRCVRLGPRGWDAARTNEVVEVGTEEAARLEGSWKRLSTDGLTVAETVDAVLTRWTFGAASLVSPSTPADAPAAGVASNRSAGKGCRVRVLWLTGPRCVGASTVGWLVAADAWRVGRRTGFIDIAQLSFTRNLTVPVGLTNGVALREVFAAAGTERFVIVAPLEIQPSDVRAAFPGAVLSVVRLDATDDELYHRALARTRGEGPMVAGDDLLGSSAADAEAVIAAAAARQRFEVRPGEIIIDTSDTDAATSLKLVTAAAGW